MDKKSYPPLGKHDGDSGYTRLTLRDKHGRHTGKSRMIRYAIYGVSICLAVVSVGMLIHYAVQTARTKQAQQDLLAEYRQGALQGNGQYPISTAAIEPLAAASSISGDGAAASAPAPATAEAATTTTANSNASTLAGSPGQAIDERFVSLYAKNKDLVGWLKAEGIGEIDFPIVRRDNEFYLTHDFYGRKSLAGTAFLDSGTSLFPRDGNVIIHAHNMKNGTMFGKLSRLMQKDLLSEYPFFVFNTLYEEALYVPYAVSLISTESGNADYIMLLSRNTTPGVSLAAYAGRLKELSVLNLPADCQEGDSLLTLVTCHGDDESQRLVIGLRKVREGEFPGILRESFMTNVSYARR